MSSNKTEKPTQKKLKDSAKKGQSFKSKDFIIACLILCSAQYLISMGSFVELMGAYRRVIANDFDYDIHRYTTAVLWIGLQILLPIILLCVFASVLPTLLQTGFVIATKALKFNFGAINPAKGFKKIFSLRTAKDAVKSLLYLATFFISALLVWHNKKGLLFQQLHGTPYDMTVVWRELLQAIVFTCLVCIIIILILDALAEFFLYIKDLKMDKQEVKREMKEQDGNPEIKSKRRELHSELLSEQIKSDVKNSNFIIANPTHIAVGIYYRPDPETASITIPFVSVLETNQRALAVRAYAKKMGVPVIQNVPLARRILKTHKRYSFISLDAIDEIIQLMIWLHQVENAGYEEVANNDSQEEVKAENSESEAVSNNENKDSVEKVSEK